MPFHKSSIRLSHQNSPLAIHHLVEEDALLAGSFFPADPKHMGATHRKNPTLFSDPSTCDDFRMYDYKVRRCMRGRSHDWTDCPFAHPGEKARRRDPRKIHYSGVPCPDFRRGSCRRGDACEFAHGVFECWLHPARYRTQPCKDGKGCTRRVCFFAHSMQQLRHVAVPAEESLVERALEDYGLYSHTHDLGSPVRMSYEHEVGLPSQPNSSEDGFSAVVLPTNSPCGAESMVGLSPQDVYANVGSISETLSMLTLSSQNVSGSPFESISTMGFPSNSTMGVPLEVHSPFPSFPTVALGPSVASSGVGAISQNDSFTFEWSSAPVIFSSASSLQPYTPVVGGLSSSNSHTTSEHSGGSPSQQAVAWQNFLMHEGYSSKGRESTFSASPDEVPDMVHHEGYGDTTMLPSYLNASGRGRPDATEAANELNGAAKSMGLTDQLALFRKEMDDFSSYNFSSYNSYGRYGLSSPTSTLAGPLHPSPFSSPPLSPLSTPSSQTSNVFSSRGRDNVQVDDTKPKADIHIQNIHCKKELEFKHTFTDRQSLHSHHHSRLLGHGKVNTALHPCCRVPLFSQCTSVQNKWFPPRNNWNSEDTYSCSASHLMFDDMQNKICDRFEGECPAENTMPDLGWVHELVM